MQLLLLSYWIHLMQSGRETGRGRGYMWCTARFLVCIILTYEPYSHLHPFRRPLQGKLDVSTTVKVQLQFVSVRWDNRVAAWVNLLLSLGTFLPPMLENRVLSDVTTLLSLHWELHITHRLKWLWRDGGKGERRQKQGRQWYEDMRTGWQRWQELRRMS